MKKKHINISLFCGYFAPFFFFFAFHHILLNFCAMQTTIDDQRGKKTPLPRLQDKVTKGFLIFSFSFPCLSNKLNCGNIQKECIDGMKIYTNHSCRMCQTFFVLNNFPILFLSSDSQCHNHKLTS